MQPGGYHRRRSEDFDRELGLLPGDVLDFILATQPKEWEKLSQHYGARVKERFLKRLSSEIERRGALSVLRTGVKDMGCTFRLAFFQPVSGLNQETRRLYAANFFAVARQVRYSTKNEKSLDLVLFLNGIPLFTAELKNPLSGQTVEDAIHQYRTDRDPRGEPLLAYGRCLGHFAVDAGLVYVTAHLAGAKTRFLPFNRGQVRRGREPARAADAVGLWHELPLGRDLGAGQRPGPGAAIHPRGRGGRRERPQDRQAVPHLSALSAARLRTPARDGCAGHGGGTALPHPALGR